MDLDDERSLLVRLRAGDTDAFDAVYDAYRPTVIGFLLRMSRNRTLAEDFWMKRGSGW